MTESGNVNRAKQAAVRGTVIFIEIDSQARGEAGAMTTSLARSMGEAARTTGTDSTDATNGAKRFREVPVGFAYESYSSYLSYAICSDTSFYGDT